METRFYRHYKNMPYKYLGVVRHSETLEELVLYETLYENKNGRLWVRPKEMFFEKIEKDGKSIFRFAPIEFQFSEFDQFDSKLMDVVRSICLDVFGEFDQLKIENRLGGKKLFLQVAYDQEIPVGFKLGYALENEVFYSWIGGVAPDYQDLGVATLFIKRQHEWCLQNGFKSIQTKSMNQFPRMISLNLNSGFKITGTEVGADEEVKILFEKSLES